MRRRCIESVAQYGLSFAETSGAAEALAAVESALAQGTRTDLFVLCGLPPEEAASLVLAVRAHKVQKEAPILVVDERLDKAKAAELQHAGADDCYVRPFLESVFAAHVRALLRRGGWKPAPPSTDLKVLGGKLVIDPPARRASVQGKPVNLSRIQFDLLELLARSEGHQVAEKALLAAADRHVSSFSVYDLELELEGLRSRLGPLGEALRREDGGGWALGAA